MQYSSRYHNTNRYNYYSEKNNYESNSRFANVGNWNNNIKTLIWIKIIIVVAEIIRAREKGKNIVQNRESTNRYRELH